MTRHTRQPPTVEAIICVAGLVGLALMLGVYVWTCFSMTLKPARETIYALRDLSDTSESQAVRVAHVRATNERAARMRLALYEYDSKWEYAAKTSCVPALVDPADMIIERSP